MRYKVNILMKVLLIYLTSAVPLEGPGGGSAGVAGRGPLFGSPFILRPALESSI